MECVKNLGLLFFSMNIVYWIILLSVEFTYCTDISDQTQSTSTPAVPNHSQSLSVSDQTQSISTPAFSEQTHTLSTSTKKSKEEDKLTLQPLPGKDDTFYTIRRGKKVFIDKTSFIEELLDDQRNCILFTRPRRFGKSNFLQMLEAFFMGKKDLFEGTHIYHRGNTDEKNGKWNEYPVVYLDFGSLTDFEGEKPSIKLFKEKLYRNVQEVANYYDAGDCKKSLEFLLQKLLAKFRLPIVVLIDEYDRAFTTILHKRPDGAITKREAELLHGMKTAMEEVFNVIKISINKRRVKLAYITGVTRLAFDALPGSGPNNVVTLTDKYSCMVGFTEDEIVRYLGPHIGQFANIEDTSPEEITKKLLKMYGGHIFSDTRKTEVINSVSVIACLTHGKFKNYWCPTHSLDIVFDKMYADEVTPEHFIGIEVPVESLYERNPTHNDIPTSIYLLLYGYLTIKEYNRNSSYIILDYPNDEIKDILVNNFNIHLMLDYPATLRKDQINILRYLKLKQIPALVKMLNKLGFRNQAPAPYQLRIEHEFNATTILYLIFRTMGLNTKIGMGMMNLPERKPLGDQDLLIMTENMNFVIEVKYEKEDKLEGLRQFLRYIIKNENAFLHYIAESRDQHKLQKIDKIYLLSLNFKKDPRGSTQSVETFIGLPFQPREPSKYTEKEEVIKLWFNHMQIKGDMKSIQDTLKSEYESVLLGKAVW